MVVVVVLVDHSVVVVVVSWRGPLGGGRRPPGESAAILAWRLPLWNGGRSCADVCSRHDPLMAWHRHRKRLQGQQGRPLVNTSLNWGEAGLVTKSALRDPLEPLLCSV